jgi:tRNA(Ile)-lysidine synthase
VTEPNEIACLRASIARFGPVDRLGVAVSGGGDSVAALVLAVEVLGADNVAAVTVDHGLRAEAAAEAAQVASLCARLGVDHQILRWSGPEGGNLQDAARQARLDLIGGWARGYVDAVVLGHTLDDQAETVLMRLARGSGVDGLSAMAEARRAQGVLWLRPFLTVPREALRDVLRARDVAWVEDPSNSDSRFQRVRTRAALVALAPLGIDAQGLAETAHRMRRARQALEQQTTEALHAYARDEAGTVLLDKAALALPPEIRDRVFAHLLMALSGSWHRPRLDALHRVIEAQGTLMGCVLVDEGAHLRLYREARAVAALETPATELWDGRWTAQGPGSGVIRALGENGLAQLSAQAKAGIHPHWRETGLSQAILLATPAIWHDEALIAAPLAFWPQKWHLSARPVAASGIGLELSH